jgi:hypothetical protein
VIVAEGRGKGGEDVGEEKWEKDEKEEGGE